MLKISSTLVRGALLAVALLASSAAAAAEVSGVHFDDSVQVNGATLQLNGAGLRSEYFVSVYVAGLYLPQKTVDSASIIAGKLPRRMVMVMKRDVGAGKMLNALHKGIVANLSESEQQALKPRLDEFDAAMTAMQEVKDGDRITLDLGADGGVLLGRNGQTQATIAGPGMAPALLKIWLGPHPAQDDLKKALLGQ